jgi:predicted DCC family thiol-disulfide oxidoreductase YuxK
MIDRPDNAAPVVMYFDGVCNLCNRAVDFFMRHDRHGRLRFAPLQGATARENGIARPDVTSFDTIVIADGTRRWDRSDAVLHAATLLGGAWRLAAVLRIVPRPLRDLVYRAVAASRFRIFGRRSTCRLPTPQERARF